MDSREQNVRLWAMLCHLSALAGLIFPLGAVLGPLIIWLIKKNELPEIDAHGKASLNFQLTVFLAYIVLMIVMIMMWGGFGLLGMAMFWRSPFTFLFGWGGFGIGTLIGLLSLAALVLAVIAGIKANNGEKFKYPVVIPFIK